MGKKKTAGRPKVPLSEKRKPAFVVQMNDEEFALIKDAAGPRYGRWAREVLLRAAKRRLK